MAVAAAASVNALVCFADHLAEEICAEASCTISDKYNLMAMAPPVFSFQVLANSSATDCTVSFFPTKVNGRIAEAMVLAWSVALYDCQ